MTMKFITAVAVATSVLAGSVASAEAGKRHGGHKVERHHKHERHHGKRKWRHGDHKFGIYFGYDGPYKRCHYYKRKAYYTGERYWYRKYRRCIDRYYY